MNPTCRDHALRILACEGDAGAFEEDLREHVAGCAECAAVVRRTARRVDVLRALERRSSPPELDGRVVAACQAGFRAERASRVLSALRRENVPLELDQKVFEPAPGAPGDSGRPAAPPVLERLLAEDLRDPSGVAARRAASRLERLKAPGSLVARVDSVIARGRAGRRARPVFWTTVVAGVVALAGLGFLLVRERAGRLEEGRPSAPQYRFEVEYATTLDGFDPIARHLLASVSGGLTSLPIERQR